MRIMHILNHTVRSNGHVHAAVDLACAQRAMGHDVCIVSGGGNFDELLAQQGVETFIVDHRRTVPAIVKAAFRLLRLVWRWKPDVIHAHMMTSAVLAFPVAKLKGLPLVTTVHNEFEKSAILMGLGDRVIAVSEAVRRSMEKRGISRKRLVVVLNGTIGSARLMGRERRPVDLEKPCVLFVGGLHPRKGLPDLLEAFRLSYQTFPDVRLFIVGGGPFEEAYKRMAVETGCGDAITFLGSVDNPLPYMSAADIFVLPSLSDPAPLVISEAREAGCAIIGTNVDGIPQLLEFGEAGMIVPPADPPGLSAAISQLLADPETMKLWRSRSQIRIENMSVARVAKETVAVYQVAASL